MRIHITLFPPNTSVIILQRSIEAIERLSGISDATDKTLFINGLKLVRQTYAQS